MIAALLVLAAVSVPGEPHPEACHRLGKEDQAASAVAFGSRLLTSPSASGSKVRMTGVLTYRFEANSLCPAGPLSESEMAKECLGVGFDWQSLGRYRREVEGVLLQWNGVKATLEGVLEIKELSPQDAKHYGIRFWKRISHVSFVETLELSPSPAFCLGYKGPRLPSPYEKTLRKLEAGRVSIRPDRALKSGAKTPRSGSFRNQRATSRKGAR